MSPEKTAALEDRVCLAYEKLTRDEAVQRGHDGLVAYRCPFGHGHWHAERLTLDEMQEIATMIREGPK